MGDEDMNTEQSNHEFERRQAKAKRRIEKNRLQQRIEENRAKKQQDYPGEFQNLWAWLGFGLVVAGMAALAIAIATNPMLALLFLFLLLPLLDYILNMIKKGESITDAEKQTPVDIAQERYIEGEISEDELEARLEAYEDSLMNEIEVDDE